MRLPSRVAAAIPVVLILAFAGTVQGSAKRGAEARAVRFTRLVVPVPAQPGERDFERITPAIHAWVEELGHRDARRRAAARAWLSRLDWRYARLLRERRDRERNTERRLALRAVVRVLRDRKYAGQAPRSFVDVHRGPGVWRAAPRRRERARR